MQSVFNSLSRIEILEKLYVCRVNGLFYVPKQWTVGELEKENLFNIEISI